MNYGVIVDQAKPFGIAKESGWLRKGKPEVIFGLRKKNNFKEYARFYESNSVPLAFY